MVQAIDLYLYADDSCFVIQEMRHLHRHNCLNTHLHMQVFRCSECEFSQDNVHAIRLVQSRHMVLHKFNTLCT